MVGYGVIKMLDFEIQIELVVHDVSSKQLE
jgi:hypothetical protein